LLINYY